MPADLPPRLDARYLRGLQLFDAGQYHAAHDAIEELWLDEVGDVKKALQALIQVAVALYHRDNGNDRGAARLLHRAAGILGHLQGELLSLDLQDLRRRCQELAEETESGKPPEERDASLIPDFTAYRAAAERERGQS